MRPVTPKPKRRTRLLRTKPPPKIPTETAEQIERINELSKTARATWLSLLGYLAFVGVTLLGVEDVDFFDPSRQTQLPLINVSIPTQQFFLFAPILGTALFAYLHFYLLKLWRITQKPPALVDGKPLADYLTPWLITDMALFLRFDASHHRLPLHWLSFAVTFLLVFIAGPAIVGAFWVRYWPAHEEWNTLAIGFAFTLSMYMSYTSLRTCAYKRYIALLRMFYKTVKDGSNQWTANHVVRKLNIGFNSSQLILIFLFIPFLGWMKTEGLWEDEKGWRLFHKDMWISRVAAPHWLVRIHEPSSPSDQGPANYPFLSLARASLVGVHLSERPTNWRNIETHKRRFRAVWCNRKHIPLDSCGNIYTANFKEPLNLWPIRVKWCEKKFVKDCRAYFKTNDAHFIAEWREERKNAMNGAKIAKLANKDLRSANLESAFLVQADLSNTQLESARLAGAHLERANLQNAGFNGSTIWQANLESVDLSNVNLVNVHAVLAKLDNGFLFDTEIRNSDFSLAKLKNANLSLTQLHRSSFLGAILEGAELSTTKIDQVELSGAQLQSVQWAQARIGHVSAQFADFRGGKNLNQNQLRFVIGDETTLLPYMKINGKSLNVWTCWEQETLPVGMLETLKRQRAQQTLEEIRLDFVCPEGTSPQPTGTPWPLDKPRPIDHPLGP